MWPIRLDGMVLSLSVLSSRVWPCKSLFIHFHLYYFRGEVVNGGFGLVLDGSQVSFVFIEQSPIMIVENNYFLLF